MKKQMFIVNNGTYPFDILVCIGQEHKDICKFIEKKKKYKLNKEEKEDIFMTGEGRTVRLRGGQTILRVGILKNKVHFRATLAHEIFHAVEFLFDRIGIKYNLEKSGEAFAYQIQYLTGSIYEKLEKNK